MIKPIAPLDPLGALAATAESQVRPASEPGGVSAEYRAKAEEAAEKFEGFFIGQLLRQMRRSAREIGGEEASMGSRTHDDMLDLADTLLGDALARQRAFGIADLILRQLLPQAEATVSSPVATRSHAGRGSGGSAADGALKGRAEPVALEQ